MEKDWKRLPSPAVVLAILFLSAGQCIAQGRPADDFVKPVAVDGLIDVPAHLFDLQGKTVRFTPKADGGYDVKSIPMIVVVQHDSPLADSDSTGPDSAKSWSVPLPFSFPFAGKTWDRIFVNLNGNISFEKSEGDYWPQRDPWADGGMCSAAAAIDSRSAAGMEQMIAVLWGPYDSNPAVSEVRLDTEGNSVTITWNVTRVALGQVVAGVSTFQARLYRSGVIEMTYPHVVERDGIVGLFTGRAIIGRQLSHWKYTGSTGLRVDINTGDVYDAGSVLDFDLTMRNPAMTKMDTGLLLSYRCGVNSNGMKKGVEVAVTDTPRMNCWFGAAPRTGGFQIHGNTIDMYVSKVLLATDRHFSIFWRAAIAGRRRRAVNSLDQAPSVDLNGTTPGQVDFLSATGDQNGNVFEVFHYPLVTKDSEHLLASIYKKVPAHDDIAIVFTDFRIDDLYAQGGGAIAANVPIQGIGKLAEKPRSTEDIGSSQLQMSAATVWLGAPLFAETGVGPDGIHWIGFAGGVYWIAQACTHRWGMDLSVPNSATGQDENLADAAGHWLDGLNAPVVYSVSDQYQDHPATGHSIMGGATWSVNADGTFSKSDDPIDIPCGFSALDLYAMGMLPADKVPDTFLLSDLKLVSENRYQGTKIPVNIADIVSAMGPRSPADGQAQKTFQMTFYVAHEPGKDVNPAMLMRARHLAAAVSDFFSRATGGEMKVVPSGS